MYGSIYFFLRFGNRRTHVTSSHRELDGTEMGMIITENQQRSCNRRDICQLFDRHHRSVHRRNQYFTDFLFILTKLFAISYHDIKFPFILIQQRSWLSANSHFNDGLNIFLSNSITCQLSFIQLNTKFRLTDIPDHSEIFYSLNRSQNLINLNSELLRFVKIFTKHFHRNRTFHTGGRFFHIICNRLWEVKVNSRING